MKVFLFRYFITIFLVILPICSESSISFSPVKPSIDILFEKYAHLLKGKRIGLIINPTSVDANLNNTIALFKTHKEINLVALFGPEHGVRGNAQAGEYVPYQFDKDYQLPVYSLYGQSEKRTKAVNLDETMRAFDTQHAGKQIDMKMLKSIDVMVFDLQDVGTRVYTYIATMAYAMQACAKAGIPFIVLDRPNPINGLTMEGSIIEYPQYSSFIGLYPIPLRHGMTVGELAQLFNAKFLNPKAILHVIPMENWQRAEWFDQTGLPWVGPSPNLPSLNSVIVYPGMVMLEGTNLSEGRGTTQPFELFGAPWIDGFVLTQKLNQLHLQGVKFREAWFTPTFSKFAGQQCRGAQLHVINRNLFQPIATTLAILSTIKNSYEDKFVFHKGYFDSVIGNSKVRKALENKQPLEKIIDNFQPDLKKFAQERKSFLLY